jgi:hypothetical protein
VVGCGGGSLGLSLLTSEVIQSRGLCGLSGIAHGLMGVSVPACHAGGVLAGILMFSIRVLAARNAAARNTGSEILSTDT